MSISIKLTERELLELGACEQGLPLFRAIASLQGNPSMIVIDEWTQLHDILLSLIPTAKDGHRDWLIKHRLVPQAGLQEADLRGINLCGAVLSGARLYGAKLNGANLEDAILMGADCRKTDFRGANLSRANLVGANLNGAKLDGANLANCWPERLNT